MGKFADLIQRDVNEITDSAVAHMEKLLRACENPVIEFDWPLRVDYAESFLLVMDVHLSSLGRPECRTDDEDGRSLRLRLQDLAIHDIIDLLSQAEDVVSLD